MSKDTPIRVAFEDAAIGMAAISPRNRFVRVNREFCKLLGFSRTALLGMTLRDVTYPDDWKTSAAIFRGMSGGPGTVRRFEERFVHKNGEVRWGAVHARRIRGTPDTHAGILIQVVDITERKKLERELTGMKGHLVDLVKESTARLRSMTDELSRAEHGERERIAKLIHDDLQQYFVGAQYHLAAASSDLLSPHARLALEQVRRALHDAMELSRTLCTRLHPPVLDTADWKPILQWIAEDFRTKFGLTVHIRARKAPPVDSTELRSFAFESIRELLMNVVKHAGMHTAGLQVSAAGKKKVVIKIVDRGTGFAPDRDRMRQFGLLRIHARADAIGGHFSVTRDTRRGVTCATLTLPLA